MLDIAEVREKNGFRFAVVQGTKADHASWWSFDDEQEVRDRWWHPQKGDLVLDIGAAFGSYTLPALVAGARVVAFSPAGFDTELLVHNLALNPYLAENCLVVRDALHERDGWFDPDHNVFCTHDSSDSQWLRTRTLDAVLSARPGIDRVDLIKMDVEGAELGVLRGAASTLRQYQPKLLIELHEFHDREISQKVLSFLSSFGYSVEGPIKHCAVSHAFYSVRQ